MANETTLSPEARKDIGIADPVAKMQVPKSFQQSIEQQVGLIGEGAKAEQEARMAKFGLETKQAQLSAEEQAAVTEAKRSEYEKGQAQMLPLEAFKPTQDNIMSLAGLFALTSIISQGSGGNGRYAGTNALGNMAAAVQGYRSGRKDLAERELKDYNANMQRVKAHNEQVTARTKELMDLMAQGKMSEYAKKKAELLAIDGGSVVAAEVKRDNIKTALKASEKIGEGIRQREDKAMALAASAAKNQAGLALPKDRQTKDQYAARYQTIKNIEDIQSLLKDPKYRNLIGPETKFTPDLINNLRANFPELSQKLARIQAIEFEIGGKALTATEQKILSPIYNWRGLTPKALDEKLEGIKQDFSNRNAMTDVYYPGMARIKQQWDSVYSQSTSPSLPGLPTSPDEKIATKDDIAVTAAKNNISEDEVKKRLRSLGYKIEGEM